MSYFDHIFDFGFDLKEEEEEDTAIPDEYCLINIWANFCIQTDWPSFWIQIRQIVMSISVHYRILWTTTQQGQSLNAAGCENAGR